MRVPVEWLHEYCAPDMPVGELATRLAMTGTEVDRVEHHGVRALEHFVVGRVLSAQPHPDADRLKVCVVDIGGGRESQIVCGAPNVAAGQTVAVARPGSVMPDGTKLKKARLRGQESDGMILAEDELGIGSDHAGTMVLAGDLVPGDPLEGVLPLSTDVLELEITPNRPDCLAVYGVARETHAATGAQLAAPPWAQDPGTFEGDVGIEVVVEAPDLCPRFTARAFENVTIGPSPPWLKARLMACGQRPINNVVDITNYVMLLTGQPMHAFDLDRIAGARLAVRRAAADEQVVTLDEQTRTVDAGVCLIADDAGPTSIAGVMGANRSEVHDDTTRVLMEAANWNAANIHATSLKLGLRSEASARFEKGLAPEQTLEGQAVATKLMLELTGARLVPGTVDVARARRGRRRPRASPARQEGRLAARRRDHALGERDAPAAPGLRHRRASRRARRHRAALPAQRRHPRGRPHRGGRPPARRQRPAARDAAAPARRRRRADRGPAAAPPRRGRADGPRAARGRRLELRVDRASRASCACPRTTRGARTSSSRTR